MQTLQILQLQSPHTLIKVPRSPSPAAKSGDYLVYFSTCRRKNRENDLLNPATTSAHDYGLQLGLKLARQSR